MEPIVLKPQESCVLMIDVQEKLVPATCRGVTVAEAALKLLTCARELKIPVLTTEQYPKGLGPTYSTLLPFVEENLRVSKTSFSCFEADGFDAALSSMGRKTVITFGIESHICVFTTAMELRRRGYQTVVVEEACGSRNQKHHDLAMKNLIAAGIGVLPLETVAYQLLGRAGTPEFKALLPLFK